MNLTPEQLRQNAAAMLALADGNPIQTRPIGHTEWRDLKINPIWTLSYDEYRPKPAWTLGRKLEGFRELSDKEEWHRMDGWTEEMLPAGWRPMLMGEIRKPGDQWYDGEWNPCGCGVELDSECQRSRTRRPLPPLKVVRSWSKPDDVPLGLIYMRQKSGDGWSVITGASGEGVWLTSLMNNPVIPWDLLRDGEWSDDRKQWHPCQVTEDAK